MEDFEYRIFRHNTIDSFYYEIHKVYLNKDKTINRVSDARPFSYTVKDLQHVLGMMINADKKKAIDWDTKEEIND